MLEEVPTVDGVVQVEPLTVAFLSREFVDGVDPALSADAVRPLHRDHADQIYVNSRLGELHRRGETRQPSANDNDVLLSHD